MKYKVSKHLLGLVLLLLPLGGGCDYDHGLDPVRTRIAGNITFVGATPPYYVREAAVVIVKKIPPDNLLNDLIISDPLPFDPKKLPDQEDVVHYELVANPGVYAAAGVLWRKRGEAWDISNVLGLHLDLAKVNFKEIVIRADQPEPDTAVVDIIADWTLAQRDARVTGKINFKIDEWRSDTDFFVLGLYSTIPQSPLEYVTGFFTGEAAFKLIFQTAPVESYQYNIEVNSEVGSGDDKGKYKFIALFWKGKAASLGDIKVIGFYNCPNDSLNDPQPKRPQTVQVTAGQLREGIDFDADFSALPKGISPRRVSCPQ